FVTDANGCVESAQVVIGEPSPLVASTITTPNTSTSSTPNGSMSASATGGTAPYTIDWRGITVDTSFNDVVFILPVCEGEYEVTITDANGCVTVDTAVVALGANAQGCTTGFEEEIAAGLQTMLLLPNPNNGTFKLRLELDRPENLTIEVINNNGQVVANKSLNRVLVTDQDFQLQNLSSGIYLVKVTTSRGAATQKLVIR
ncbi:MAG: T9SS type A sorting domain-containing protein, partial [Bacteroidota bacterium]